MSDLMRRAAPGVAVISAALATVWLFDPALRSDAADQAAGTTTQQSAGDATAGDEGSGTDPGSGGDATSGDTGSDDSASEGSAESGAAEEGSAESGAAEGGSAVDPAPADPSLVVPAQPPRHPTQRVEQHPHPGQQIPGRA